MCSSRQRNGQALLHVVGISGSLRPGSYTRMALDIALQGAQHAGASIQLIDLRDYELPFCAGKIGELERSQDLLRLRQAVHQAQAVILATPVYHGSFSGVLKNALDAIGFEEFEGKIIGLLGVSGGPLGAADALTGLQVVSRSLHAWLIPQQVSIAEAWNVFEADGSIKDHGVERRLKQVGQQVVGFAYLHTSKQALEFLYQSAFQRITLQAGLVHSSAIQDCMLERDLVLHQWEEAVANPGGGTRVQMPPAVEPGQPG